MRLRFGKLENGAEVPQRTAYRPTLDADRIKLGCGQVEVEPRKLHLALAIEEHAGPAERHADMIAAAFTRPFRQRQQNAVGGKIASCVVTGGSRQERRPVGAPRVALQSVESVSGQNPCLVAFSTMSQLK